ncbi:MAG: LPS export ABC transporter periplasmic protein LptC [Pseudomonadales bacterium]
MSRFTPMLLLLLAAGLAWYLLREPAEEVADDVTEVVERKTPDLFGEQIRFNQLHADGHLHYRLDADSIEQFNADNLTRMAMPRLHLRSAAQPPWDIQSEEGFIRKTTTAENIVEDIVYLRQKVQMRQENPENGPITLRSESIYLYPDRQFAETQQGVIIDTEVGRTTAAGLTADLESGLLRLSSNATQRVHTIVLPEQFKKS